MIAADSASPVGDTGSSRQVSAPDEAALLGRLRAGDEAAFEQLVRDAGGRMLAVARRMMGREDDAQDAVQEAFLSVLRSLDRFDGRSQLATWLHRITVNACLMKLRTRRRRPEQPIEDFLPVFTSDGHQERATAQWRADSAAGMQRHEVRAQVRAAIDTLPEQYRVVLLLRDIEELSTQETASALGITETAAKTRLHRARQALRAILEPIFSSEAP